MATNGFNGGLCLIYKGLYAAKTDIVGQGDASITHGGGPIEINNKSSGGWRVNLDGSTSTRSVDIDIEFTTSDEASLETLVADAFACGVNDLPLSIILSWYEQKAVVILLTLLNLGIKDIRIGPTMPAFVTPKVQNVLVENFAIKSIAENPQEDLKTILA